MSGILPFCCESAPAQDHTLMTVSTFRSGVGGLGIQYDVGLHFKTCSKASKWFETRAIRPSSLISEKSGIGDDDGNMAVEQLGQP